MIHRAVCVCDSGGRRAISRGGTFSKKIIVEQRIRLDVKLTPFVIALRAYLNCVYRLCRSVVDSENFYREGILFIFLVN